MRPMTLSEKSAQAEEDDRVLIQVLDETGVKLTDVISPSRRADVVAKRRLVARKLYDRIGSFPRVGKVMGLHHTTVINLVWGVGWRAAG